MKLTWVFLVAGAILYAQPKGAEKERKAVNVFLNQWHQAAAEADFERYFSMIAPDGVFIGTDATENWQYEAFKAFAKPYFDRGKAWTFTAVERHIYIDKKLGIVWFDELLDTQMKICRGSGVLKKIHKEWKVVHYVLSLTIPNEQVKEVVANKQGFDEALLKQLKEKRIENP